MSADRTWNVIVSSLENKTVEIPTVPSNRREPLWFKAYLENGNLYVNNSDINMPSTNMSMQRKISREDFDTVYAYYERWSNGERYLRQEVRLLSRNTAYIFGLITHFRVENM